MAEAAIILCPDNKNLFENGPTCGPSLKSAWPFGKNMLPTPNLNSCMSEFVTPRKREIARKTDREFLILYPKIAACGNAVGMELLSA